MKLKDCFTQQNQQKLLGPMRLSLAVGCLMLVLKCSAYVLTGSAAILSDAAESIVHVFAVGFAAYSLKLSLKPADKDHPYGHDRVAFFSAGLEGALITLAAIFIAVEATKKLFSGVELEHLDLGMLFVSIATALNGFLGTYLVRRGRKYHSLVLEADGKHILTDCLTSLGVIIALVLTWLTGLLILDPLIALLIAGNILWTGFRLMREAVQGLMDQAEPELEGKIRSILSAQTEALGIDYHHLRYRNAGTRLLIEAHLLFPDELTLTQAHELATRLEKRVEGALEKPAELITHLEPRHSHDEIHNRLLGRQG